MKKTIKYFTFFLMIITSLLSCSEDLDYIDGMVSSLTQKSNDKLPEISMMEWNSALVNLQTERQKTANIRAKIVNGEYTDDEYDLKNPEALKIEVESVLSTIDFKIDSIWNLNIKDTFMLVDKDTEGVKTFGTKTFTETNLTFSAVSNWLKSEYKADTNNYIPNDLEVLKKNISDLYSLTLLDANDVIAYVDNLNNTIDQIGIDKQSIVNEIATSPYFSLAQKELYEDINSDISKIKESITSNNISLQTNAELDIIANDLYSLTYFVDNNYTSPALAPKVYGEISNISELRWFSEEATDDDYAQDWALTADIDAAETHRWNLDQPEQGFQQIFEYTGNFDGQYHIISGMLLTKYAAVEVSRAGMFHYFLGGTMQNLGLVNLYVNSTIGNSGQGGTLIAYLKGENGETGTVERCFVHGTKELCAQDAGFIGRIRGTTVIQDCFSAVDCLFTGAAGTNASSTSSFFATTILGPHVLKNLINIGVSQNTVFCGGGAQTNISEASGLYFDETAVGKSRVESNSYATTTMKLTDDGIVTNLPTSDWADLSNFGDFSPEVWEIKTISLIDDAPRPYLSGFDYDKISTFIIPDFSVY